MTTQKIMSVPIRNTLHKYCRKYLSPLTFMVNNSIGYGGYYLPLRCLFYFDSGVKNCMYLTYQQNPPTKLCLLLTRQSVARCKITIKTGQYSCARGCDATQHSYILKTTYLYRFVGNSLTRV